MWDNKHQYSDHHSRPHFHRSHSHSNCLTWEQSCKIWEYEAGHPFWRIMRSNLMILGIILTGLAQVMTIPDKNRSFVMCIFIHDLWHNFWCHKHVSGNWENFRRSLEGSRKISRTFNLIKCQICSDTAREQGQQCAGRGRDYCWGSSLKRPLLMW